MKKTAYEVKEVRIETRDGKNPLNVFNNASNQDTYLIKRFDTLEEARAFFATVKTDVRSMDRYFLHTGKIIEQNEYEIDENGEEEWIAGGDWWDFEIPEVE